MEGYVFKWHPQHAKVKSLIAEGKIGTPRFFSAEFTYPQPPAGDIRLNPELGGGVLHDSAGYAVAAAVLQLPGKPVSVFCQLTMDEAANVDNGFCLWMRFDTGAVAQLLVAFGTHYRSRYSILGSKGRIELLRAFAVPPDAPAIIQLETGSGEEKITVEPADQFRLMIEDVSAQFRTGKHQSSVDELLRQHAIMDAATRSIGEGRMIDLADYNL